MLGWDFSSAQFCARLRPAPAGGEGAPVAFHDTIQGGTNYNTSYSAF